MEVNRGVGYVAAAVVVASAFWWSGVVHMGLVPPEPIGRSTYGWELKRRVAALFLVQVLGIVVQCAVETLLGRRPGWLGKIIVSIWVVVFLATSAQMTVGVLGEGVWDGGGFGAFHLVSGR